MSAITDEIRAAVRVELEAERETVRDMLRAELDKREADRWITGWKSIGATIGRSASAARALYNRGDSFALVVVKALGVPSARRSDLDRWVAGGGK